MSRVSSFIAAGALAASSPVASSEIKKEVSEVAIGANIEKNLYKAGQCAYEQQQNAKASSAPKKAANLPEQKSTENKAKVVDGIFNAQGKSCGGYFHNLKVLMLGGKDFSVEVLDSLKKYSDAENVTFFDMKITDEVLEKVAANFPNIKEIGIYKSSINGVSDKGIEYLKSLHNLNALMLDHIGISPESFEACLSIPQLKAVSMSHMSLNTEDVEVIVDIIEECDSSIEEISLAYNPRITEAGIYHLSRLSYQLKALDLSGTGVFKDPSAVDKVCNDLCNCYKLERLNLSGTNMPSTVLPLLASHESLKEITIDGKSLDASCIKDLARFKNLESIDFNGLECSVQDLEPLRGLPNLKTLRGVSKFFGSKKIVKGVRVFMREHIDTLIEWFPKVNLRGTASWLLDPKDPELRDHLRNLTP